MEFSGMEKVTDNHKREGDEYQTSTIQDFG